jgi:ElaB/YqjD/DUF883 family membrane-anchored ribosome-binding protein
MKTLTEFHSFALKAVAQLQNELTQAGKTAEEITAAIGEKLKAEGDKLKHLMTAFDAAKDRLDKLKRVLVIQPAEGAKLVRDAIEKEGLHFVLEFFPEPPGQQKGRRDHDEKRGGRDGKKGRGGKGKRDGKRGGGRGGERAERGERRAAPAAEGAAAQAPRAPRAPRPPRERKPEEPPKPFVPSGNAPLIKPKSAVASSASVEQPAAAPAESSSS